MRGLTKSHNIKTAAKSVQRSCKNAVSGDTMLLLFKQSNWYLLGTLVVSLVRATVRYDTVAIAQLFCTRHNNVERFT